MAFKFSFGIVIHKLLESLLELGFNASTGIFPALFAVSRQQNTDTTFVSVIEIRVGRTNKGTLSIRKQGKPYDSRCPTYSRSKMRFIS